MNTQSGWNGVPLKKLDDFVLVFNHFFIALYTQTVF